MEDQYTEEYDMPEQNTNCGLVSNMKLDPSFLSQKCTSSNNGHSLTIRDKTTAIDQQPVSDLFANSINIDKDGHRSDTNDSKNKFEQGVTSKPFEKIQNDWSSVTTTDSSHFSAVELADKPQEYSFSNNGKENSTSTIESDAVNEEDFCDNGVFDSDHDIEIDDSMPIDFSMKPKILLKAKESEHLNTEEENLANLDVEESNRKWFEYLKSRISNDNSSLSSKSDNDPDRNLNDLKEDKESSLQFPYHNQFLDFFPFLNRNLHRNLTKQNIQTISNSSNPTSSFSSTSFPTFPYSVRPPTMNGNNSIFQGCNRESLGYLSHFYSSYQLNFLQNLIQNHQFWMMTRNNGWGFARDASSKVNKNVSSQNNLKTTTSHNCLRKSDYSTIKHRSTHNLHRYNKRSFLSRAKSTEDKETLPNTTSTSSQKKNCSPKNRFSKFSVEFGHTVLTDKTHSQSNKVLFKDIFAKNNDTASELSLAKVSQTAISCLGDFICQLCSKKFENSFGLASHNCSKMVKIKYECPQCEKVFNCPANLASHRRWHRPKL